MRTLGTLARIVRGAIAGAMLTRAGNALELPGLLGHALLAPTSPVITVAARKLAEGVEHLSFLSPLPGQETPVSYLRITVLAACP